MTDIVERLRDPCWQQEYNPALPTMREAAAEIERLRAENEQLKIALSDGPRDDGTHVHRLDEREGDQ